MTYRVQAVDADEYFHDTDYEIAANQQMYGVFSGCAVSYDASNMTIDIGQGTIVHNGVTVQVAEQLNALTLVADGSNERWAYICLDSAGSAVLVSGDAAPDGSTEPTKPELGDRVLLAMVKIQAAQTIAANTEYQLDKRVPIRQIVIDKPATETVNSSTTLQNDDDFLFWAEASVQYLVELDLAPSATVNSGIKLSATYPTGATQYVSGELFASAFTFGSGSGLTLTGRPATIASAANWWAVTAAQTGGMLHAKALLLNSTTAGAWQLQFAQNASHADDTSILIASRMRVTRI